VDSDVSVKTFREILGVPSAALQAMVDGLRLYGNRLDFKIDMGTFGSNENGVCFGCAASCCVQKVLGKNLLSGGDGIEIPVVRARFFGTAVEDLGDFEWAVDGARSGSLSCLLGYFGINEMTHQSIVELNGQWGVNDTIWDSRYELNSDDWEQQLGAVEEVIAEMKAIGI